MFRLHLSRALLAAGISLVLCSALPLLIHIIGKLKAGSGLPTPIELQWLLKMQPRVIPQFLSLYVLLTLPLAGLWFARSSRRTLSVPWMATVCGGCLGILASPVWYVFLAIAAQRSGSISVDEYLEGFHVIGPISAIAGALYFFLHSFFIRQALGKKAWLGTRA